MRLCKHVCTCGTSAGGCVWNCSAAGGAVFVSRHEYEQRLGGAAGGRVVGTGTVDGTTTIDGKKAFLPPPCNTCRHKYEIHASTPASTHTDTHTRYMQARIRQTCNIYIQHTEALSFISPGCNGTSENEATPNTVVVETLPPSTVASAGTYSDVHHVCTCSCVFHA